MAIHISIGNKSATLLNKRFETAEEAQKWWVDSGLMAETNMVSVLKDAKDNYIQHEIPLLDGKGGYFNAAELILEVEGSEKDETFDARHDDVVAEKIVVVTKGHTILQLEYYGVNSYEERVWGLIKVHSEVRWKVSPSDNT